MEELTSQLGYGASRMLQLRGGKPFQTEGAGKGGSGRKSNAQQLGMVHGDK